jgi:hypothetical protein
MNLPRLTAAASIYTTITRLNSLYLAIATGGSPPVRSVVGSAADSFQCTSPNCTWSCPPLDLCLQQCGKILNACARKRCVCTCEGGVPVSAPDIPCGFVCT